jgi:2,3-bisphosphoglycerate-dependent phosphoglycerate mutase
MSVGPHLLVLVRHGQSEGNRLNIFTGWQDLPLSARGGKEARLAGRHLLDKGIVFDTAFASTLSRASGSCSLMLEAMGQDNIPIEQNIALNERDYGDLTGLNKDEARRQFGDEQVRQWRRSYAAAPPNGESLRDTIARVLPFYIRSILPAAMRGRATLVVAHGNSLRSLIFALEESSTETIVRTELGTAEMRFYRIDDDAVAKLEGRWTVPADLDTP